MRFFHLADLHLGKRLGNISLIPDQEYILEQILALIKEYRPQALLLAGDIYDRSTPSTDAVKIFDDFLTALAKEKLPVLIISGNHDSPERLDFGSRIMEDQQIYIEGSFEGGVKEVELTDEYGSVFFHLLPFVRPSAVRPFFPEEQLPTYDTAVRHILQQAPKREGCRKVLIAHQFVTAGSLAPIKSDSEQVNVGGLDNIDASAFDGYHYTALGHIHKPQTIGGENLRYAGSLLKYSFSEAMHEKSMPMIDMDKDGSITTTLLPLKPLHDTRKIKGPLEKLLSKEVAEAGDRMDYLHITLTDEEDPVDPLTSLRNVYPNVLKLEIANSRSKQQENICAAAPEESKTPSEMFRDFYMLQHNTEPDEKKMKVVQNIFEKLEGKD